MPEWAGRDAHGKGAFIMKIATVGLDLARNVLQLHGVDSQRRLVVRKQLRRTDVLRYFAKLEPRVVGMEACRPRLQQLAHGTVNSSTRQAERLSYSYSL